MCVYVHLVPLFKDYVVCLACFLVCIVLGYSNYYHTACKDGDLRLMDGNTTREGRVEICYDNVYGTVCDDQWGPLDAAVACRQLGFSDAGIMFYRVCFIVSFLYMDVYF